MKKENSKNGGGKEKDKKKNEKDQTPSHLILKQKQSVPRKEHVADLKI